MKYQKISLGNDMGRCNKGISFYVIINMKQVIWCEANKNKINKKDVVGIIKVFCEIIWEEPGFVIGYENAKFVVATINMKENDMKDN